MTLLKFEDLNEGDIVFLEKYFHGATTLTKAKVERKTKTTATINGIVFNKYLSDRSAGKFDFGPQVIRFDVETEARYELQKLRFSVLNLETKVHESCLRTAIERRSANELTAIKTYLQLIKNILEKESTND